MSSNMTKIDDTQDQVMALTSATNGKRSLRCYGKKIFGFTAGLARVLMALMVLAHAQSAPVTSDAPGAGTSVRSTVADDIGVSNSTEDPFTTAGSSERMRRSTGEAGQVEEASTPHCTIPDNLAEQLREAQRNAITDTFMLPPAGSVFGQENAYTIEMGENELYGDASCRMATTGHVKDRSTCPWVIKINHDPTRYPKDIRVASCRCTSCQDGSANHCEEISTPTFILRQKDCRHGLWRYTPEWLPVPSGCTCVNAGSP